MYFLIYLLLIYCFFFFVKFDLKINFKKKKNCDYYIICIKESEFDQYLQFSTYNDSLAFGSFDPPQTPNQASELALALTMKAAQAAAIFSSFPFQVFTAVFYKARPQLKVKAHGCLILSQGIWFMAFKLREASSSDYPPLKNTTPTKAGTTVLERARTVLQAMTSAVTFGALDPGVTMFGFKRHPSKKMLFSYKALNTADKTLSVTF